LTFSLFPQPGHGKETEGRAASGFACPPGTAARPAVFPAFRAIRSLLEPDGDFLFDVLRWRDTPRTVFLRRDSKGTLQIVWEFSVDPTTGRGRVVGQFLETGAIQDSERNFYTAPEVTTLLELAGFERLTVAGDLTLGMSAQEAEPSFFFRARRR